MHIADKLLQIMPWRPLPRIAFAICTYPFQPSSAADLPLQIGDELYIIEQGGKDGEWFRGYLVAPPSLLAGLTTSKGQALEARVFSGIFPRACVDIKEELGEVAPHAVNGNGYSTRPNSLQADQSHAKSTQSPRISGEWPTPPRGVPSPKQTEDAEQPNDEAEQNGSSQHAEENGGPSSAPTKRPQKPPAPVPMLKIGDETSTIGQEPLVDEIASCLREWHSTNLHELLLSRKNVLLEEVIDLVSRLDSARRQLLHKILTQKEMEQVREAVIWDLVHGNRLLSGEVIVRSAAKRGRMLTADDSPVEISSLQSMMSLLDGQQSSSPDSRILHHVLFTLKGFRNETTKVPSLLVSLYAADARGTTNMISEAFVIDAPPQDTTTDDDQDLRVLFTDLSVNDLRGASGESLRVYLTVKVLTNEPLRESPTLLESNGDESASRGINNALRNSNVRRSMMFGAKEKKEKGTATPTESRPVTGRSTGRSTGRTTGRSTGRTTARSSRPMTPELRPGSAGEDSPAATSKKLVKRATGITVLDITDLLQTEAETQKELPIWSLAFGTLTPLEEENEELTLDQTVIAAMAGSPANTLTKPSASRIRVSLRSFAHSDSERLIQSTPTVLHNTPTTRRIGFGEAPSRPRSDIYLTLLQPMLAPNGFLSHPKQGSVPLPHGNELCNLQLTLEVRNAAGDRIDNCIYPCSNSSGHTAWRTTAAERGESWNQTIRLAISPEEVPGSHIVMSIADAAVNFPFALCWMPLWTQEAFVRDSEYSLMLHKYDEYTSDMVAGKRAYLGLPWSSKAKDESVTGPAATLRLRTFLCSTQYSQDPILLGILKWREQRSRDLVALLARFPFVPELEIVKLLGDLLDALFEILVQYGGNDEIEDPTFSALLVVLGIVHDRRFNLQPRVDEYARDRFKYPFAFPCLVRGLRRLLRDSPSSESSRRLRSACKVGSHIFKFMVCARKQQIVKEVDIGIQNHGLAIAKDLRPIFSDMHKLMRDPTPTLIGTKTLIVRYFADWLAELSTALSATDMLQIATDFVESCSGVQGKLILYKLLMINAVTTARLFQDSQEDHTWNERVVEWIAPYWGHSNVSPQQWRDQARICCSIVASQQTASGFMSGKWMPKLVDSFLEAQKNPQPPRKEISLLYPNTYPFPSKAALKAAIFDELLIEISSLLAALAKDAVNYPREPVDEQVDLLQNLLRVQSSILNCEAFPSSWLSLHIFHHKAALQCLQAVFSILKESHLPPPEDAETFPTELWNVYLTTLLELVASDALALETFPEQKRRAVWKIAGDVRELGAELLQRSWSAIAWDASPEDKEQYALSRIGGYQVQYVPGLVTYIVRLCLSVHEGLRGAAIEILESMIVSEWALAQDLHIIQAEMIQCLDQMFRENRFTDAIVQKAFANELLQKFDAHKDGTNSDLHAAVTKLVGVINELLDLLVAVHSAQNDGEASQIVDTLKLMNFLRDLQKETIYIGYVHKLAQIQLRAKNPTEAALALRMHADLYDWDNSKQVDHLLDPQYPSQTALERKELIYFEMLSYFEDGNSWHHALSGYSELANVYQTISFDFAKLARTQRAMATLHEKIHRGERQLPRYFRVIFRGLGFSQNLRDKEFIFEAQAGDRLSAFADTLLQQYPSARIMSGLVEDELEGQYISVYPVSPQKDYIHPINRRLKVVQSVRDHYILSEPKSFAMSSRRQASGGGVEDQVQDKTIYTTAEAFPNILRRSEVVDTKVVRLTPVQIGLERTLRKTQDLTNLEAKAREGGDAALAALTDALRLVLRSKSIGSVAEYWKLVPQPDVTESVEDGPVDAPKIVLSPLQEALKVALMDHVSVIRSCLSLYSKPALQSTRAELAGGEWKQADTPMLFKR